MQLASLVRDEPRRGIFRVHRSVFSSAELLEREWERIFERVWLYVGHESEVERPGDYRRRTLARRPVLFVRGADGQVRTVLNVCRHRGAMLCRESEATQRPSSASTMPGPTTTAAR